MGETLFFWFVTWHPWGILFRKFLELKQKLNIGLEARVSDVIWRGQWNLLYGRGCDSQVIAFNRACQGITITNIVDNWKWTPST